MKITTLIAFAFLCFFLTSCSTFDEVDFKGNSNFSHSSDSKLSTEISAEKSTLIFESKDKKWALNLKNKINFDHDHFGKETKTNIFSTIGIDF